MAGKVLIGTSGWSYNRWLGGAFYPTGVHAHAPRNAETLTRFVNA